jgi:hypothetical protein
MVGALLELAIAAEADEELRLGSLIEYAEACEAAGHADACAEALAESLRIMRAAAELPSADTAAIASRARTAGRLAARLDRADLVREAWLLESQQLWSIAGHTARPSTALLEAGRVEHRAGELDAARESFRDALHAEEASDDPSVTAIGQALHELGLVESELGNLAEATELLSTAVRRLSDELADDHPLITFALESLASVATRAGHPSTAKAALEWRLAATRATDAGDDPALSLLGELRPIVAQVDPNESPGGGILEPDRAWAFDLRRRALDGEDLRAWLEPYLDEFGDALDPMQLWPDEAPGDEPVPVRVRRDWDSREADLGDELVRALERYLMLQIVDQRALADKSSPALRRVVIGDFFAMLLNVDVEVQE